MATIIPLAMGKVRQPVVIADQLSMELHRLVNVLASCPAILAEARLNTELAFDQVLPWMSLRIHPVSDLQAPVDAAECAGVELLAVI
jgi:hypothetical protein